MGGVNVSCHCLSKSNAKLTIAPLPPFKLTRLQDVFCNSNPMILSAARTAGGSTEPRLLQLLVVANCDLQPGVADPELRLALQWIAASELGLPALHFRMSHDLSADKVGGAKSQYLDTPMGR